MHFPALQIHVGQQRFPGEERGPPARHFPSN